MSETVKRITELQLCGSDSRAQSYNEGLKAAIHILESCEQPQLNENQKDLVIWMQENECSTDDPLESISDLFLEGTPSEYFPDAPLSCVEAAYQSLSKKQKLELVKEYVKKALEQEE